MKKFELKENKICMNTEIEEGDVLILENGNYEIIRTINYEKGIIKTTIIDTEDMTYCKGEMQISRFLDEGNMQYYYTKMEEQ